MEDSEIHELSSDIRLACMRIARRARAESRSELPQHHYAVLTQLEDGPLTLRGLADREGVSAPVMTRNINELAGLGLVRRENDPSDGRQVMVTLTPEGNTVRETVKRNRDEWMAARLADLDEEDLHRLRAAAPLLERLAIG